MFEHIDAAMPIEEQLFTQNYWDHADLHRYGNRSAHCEFCKAGELARPQIDREAQPTGDNVKEAF
jgi:hypothetical protein